MVEVRNCSSAGNSFLLCYYEKVIKKSRLKTFMTALKRGLSYYSAGLCHLFQKKMRGTFIWVISWLSQSWWLKLLEYISKVSSVFKELSILSTLVNSSWKIDCYSMIATSNYFAGTCRHLSEAVKPSNLNNVIPHADLSCCQVHY